MKPPAGDGVPLLYVTSVMLCLAWIVLGTRVWLRKWLRVLGTDDYLMCAGLILYTVTCSLVIVCCFYGAGQHSAALDKADISHGTKLFFIAQFFYASCSALIKSSICVTLLRVADSRRRFVWTLWAVIAAAAGSSVVFILAIANICHPVAALWGEAVGVCNTSLNSSVGFFFSAVSIATDFTLAILPGVLLWSVQLKAGLKATLAVILGLAAIASCATIVRLRYLTLYNNPAEFMYSTGAIGLWSILEEGIGIVAGSIPALRPLLSLRARMESQRAAASTDPNQPRTAAATPRHRKGGLGLGIDDTVNLTTFHRLSSAAGERHDDDDDDENHRQYHRHRKEGNGDGDGDSDSDRQILKHTQVTVTAEDDKGTDDWDRAKVLGWIRE